jgi:hypothetical protein
MGLIDSLCMPLTNADDVTKVVGVTTVDILRSLLSSEQRHV